jgi:hypothetical protein
MRGLRAKIPTGIGYPYHGLARGYHATFPGAVTLTVSAINGCFVARHPNPPAINRTPEQLADDAANGWEWRDYALLCGAERHFNGNPSAELGENGWLYVDGNGRAWHMTLHHDAPVDGSFVVRVKRRRLFGHFGGDYSGISVEEVGTYTFNYELPQHYIDGGGSYTAADAMANQLADVFWFSGLGCELIPSADGSSVIVNMRSSSGIIGAMYGACRTGYDDETRYLFGVLQIDVTGSGDQETGIGISAAISTLIAGPSLIIENVDTSNPDTGPQPALVTTWSPPEAFPLDNGTVDGEERTITRIPSYSYTDNEYWSANVVERFRAVCLHTPHGSLERIYERIAYNKRTYGASGSGSVDYNWVWNDFASKWDYVDCDGSAAYTLTRDTEIVEQRKISYVFNGTVVDVFDGREETINHDPLIVSVTYSGTSACGGIEDHNNPVSSEHTFLVNGQDYASAGVTLAQLYPDAVAMVYGNVIVTHAAWDSLTGGWRWKARAARAYGESGFSGELWSELIEYEMPVLGDPRAWGVFPNAMSYQPVTNEFAIGVDQYEPVQYF